MYGVMMQLVLILKIYLIKKPVLLQAFAGGNVIPRHGWATIIWVTTHEKLHVSLRYFDLHRL